MKNSVLLLQGFERTESRGRKGGKYGLLTCFRSSWRLKGTGSKQKERRKLTWIY